jgi:hypothetical protein
VVVSVRRQWSKSALAERSARSVSVCDGQQEAYGTRNPDTQGWDKDERPMQQAQSHR